MIRRSLGVALWSLVGLLACFLGALNALVGTQAGRTLLAREGVPVEDEEVPAEAAHLRLDDGQDGVHRDGRVDHASPASRARRCKMPCPARFRSAKCAARC